MSEKRIFDLRNKLRQYHFKRLQWIDDPMFGNSAKKDYSNISNTIQASEKDIWNLNNALFFHSKAIVERTQHAINQIQQKVEPSKNINKFMKEY